MTSTPLMVTRRAALLGSAALASSCASSWSVTRRPSVVWEHRLVGSGDSRPDFDVETQLNTDVLVRLHKRERIASIEEIGARRELLRRGFVRDGVRGPAPSVVVAGFEDARRWFAVSHQARHAGVNMIERHAPQVRERAMAMECLRRLGWERVSLFVMSNVLLDAWQIDAVERRWLRAERPLRSGGRYYYALLARRRRSERDAFGLYGDQFHNYGDIGFGLYGNRRLSSATLPRLDLDTLRIRFGVEADSARAAHEALTRRLAAAARGEVQLSVQEQAGFASLGLLTPAGVAIPVMREADYLALEGLAAIVRDDLVEVLDAERARLRAAYDSSPYAEETTFEEYLIWWYHFFFTEITNRLADRDVLRAPRGGVASYVVAE